MISASESRSRIAALLLVGAVLGRATAARANEPDAAMKMAARELAMEGAEAFDRGDYPRALDRFQRADTLFTAPSLRLMVARSLARLGRLVEAADKYEETLRTPLEPNAPEAFRKAVSDARAEVETLRVRLPRLIVRVPDELAPNARVLLDGKPLSAALYGIPRPTDPGAHRVTATAPGRRPFSADVSLEESQTETVQLELARAAPARAAAPAERAPAATHTPRWLGWSLAGVGVAAAGIGTVTGLVALDKKSELDDRCDSAGCPAGSDEDIDSFRTNRTLSYVSFGVAALAAGAGTYFLLRRDDHGREVRAAFTPSGAALTGSF